MAVHMPQIFTLSIVICDSLIFLAFFVHNHLPILRRYFPVNLVSISSSQVAHDAPKASECLYPVIHVEQVKPFRSLQHRMAPILIFRNCFWKVAGGYKVEVSTVDS
jgi:hypothetical protein